MSHRIHGCRMHCIVAAGVSFHDSLWRVCVFCYLFDLHNKTPQCCILSRAPLRMSGSFWRIQTVGLDSGIIHGGNTRRRKWGQKAETFQWAGTISTVNHVVMLQTSFSSVLSLLRLSILFPFKVLCPFSNILKKQRCLACFFFFSWCVNRRHVLC